MSDTVIIAIVSGLVVVVVVALLLNRSIRIKRGKDVIETGRSGALQDVRAKGGSSIEGVKQEGGVGEQKVSASGESKIKDIEQKKGPS